MLSIADAQRDMREGYYGGATGAVTSATAWLIAAIVATRVDATTAMWTLIFAGMLIFPVSVVLDRLLGRSGNHSKDNPLAPLAWEGTIWMILTIPVAIGASYHKAEWFFPAMLLIIAGRYLTFTTLFGMKIYWAFGVTLAVAAFALVKYEASAAAGAFAGAGIEYVYGIAMFMTLKPDTNS